MAEADGEAAGFALFFTSYSTWRGHHGIRLEDLYVSPRFRGRGIGKALLSHLARVALEEGCPRLEWDVLAWNTPAIEFYHAQGARMQTEWRIMRVADEALARLAQTETKQSHQSSAEPLSVSLAAAPFDDEELTPETIEAIKQGERDSEEGRTVSHADLLREFGVTGDRASAGCCPMLAYQVACTCERHTNPFDCPDALVLKGEHGYGLIVHDGGSSSIAIAYCPWCGASLA
jgi:predicted GNAT family acetyltransferase